MQEVIVALFYFALQQAVTLQLVLFFLGDYILQYDQVISAVNSFYEFINIELI